ncbi:hypothetical protein [Paenibacillus sp. QZ-Y1]|uniref:hypothetical protein n=1 Tax=Paenibacillus sp. QZ-Y1 TaxID=3414511 RepID=UPI003F7AC74C
MKYKKREEYKIISRYPNENDAVAVEIMEAQILNWMEFILLNYSFENKLENKQNSEDRLK